MPGLLAGAGSRGLLAPLAIPDFGHRAEGNFGNAVRAGLLGMSFTPAGDALGLLQDAHMYATDPRSRTMGNYGLSALGVLPFAPNAAMIQQTRRFAPLLESKLLPQQIWRGIKLEKDAAPSRKMASQISYFTDNYDRANEYAATGLSWQKSLLQAISTKKLRIADGKLIPEIVERGGISWANTPEEKQLMQDILRKYDIDGIRFMEEGAPTYVIDNDKAYKHIRTRRPEDWERNF